MQIQSYNKWITLKYKKVFLQCVDSIRDYWLLNTNPTITVSSLGVRTLFTFFFKGINLFSSFGDYHRVVVFVLRRLVGWGFLLWGKKKLRKNGRKCKNITVNHKPLSRWFCISVISRDGGEISYRRMEGTTGHLSQTRT